MEHQIIKHLDKKIFGIAIDAGSGLKKALKQARGIDAKENDLLDFLTFCYGRQKPQHYTKSCSHYYGW